MQDLSVREEVPYSICLAVGGWGKCCYWIKYGSRRNMFLGRWLKKNDLALGIAYLMLADYFGE
jgi:hypothetical protein